MNLAARANREHRTHWVDIKIHADKAGRTIDVLDVRDVALRIWPPVEGVVNSSGERLKARLIFLAERALVHIVTRGLYLLGRDVPAFESCILPGFPVRPALCGRK